MSHAPQPLFCHRDRIPASVAEVAPARLRFLTFLASQGVSADERDTWALVFNEAVVNAIVHGTPAGIQDPQVSIEFRTGDGDGVLEVTQPGPGPGPEKLQRWGSLPEDPLSTGGRGCFLIANAAREVRHCTHGDRYTLMILRQTPTPEPEAMIPASEVDSILGELALSYEKLSSFHTLTSQIARHENEIALIKAALRTCMEVHNLAACSCLLPDDSPVFSLAGPESDSLIRPLTSAEATLLPRVSGSEPLVWDGPGERPPELSEPSRFPQGCLTPIRTPEAVIGIVVAGATEPGPPLQSGVTSHLQTVSDIVGTVLYSFRLRREREARQAREREIALATEIQRELLPIPRLTRHGNWEVFADRRTTHEVGGDHIEILPLPDGGILVAIIDVMGKGVGAAMLASLFRNALLFSLESCGGDPVAIARRINDSFCRQFGGLTIFITATIARIDPAGEVWSQVNAGHCPTGILAPGRKAVWLEATAPPLAIFPGQEYQLQMQPLDGVDAISLFTDGCYEWAGADSGFALPAWQKLIEQIPPGSVESFWETDFIELRESTSATGNADDETLLFLRRLP